MDGRRFDAFTETLGRRGLLRAAITLVGSTLLPAADASAQALTCDLKQKGERCRNGDACCSGRCKKRNNWKRGRCRCGKLRTPCFDNFDCCGASPAEPGSIVCSTHDDFAEIVCCVSITGPCQTSADCCSDLECNGNACGSGAP